VILNFSCHHPTLPSSKADSHGFWAGKDPLLHPEARDNDLFQPFPVKHEQPDDDDEFFADIDEDVYKPRSQLPPSVVLQRSLASLISELLPIQSSATR
jgi:hypothetical protein